MRQVCWCCFIPGVASNGGLCEGSTTEDLRHLDLRVRTPRALHHTLHPVLAKVQVTVVTAKKGVTSSVLLTTFAGTRMGQ